MTLNNSWSSSSSDSHRWVFSASIRQAQGSVRPLPPCSSLPSELLVLRNGFITHLLPRWTHSPESPAFPLTLGLVNFLSLLIFTSCCYPDVEPVLLTCFCQTLMSPAHVSRATGLLAFCLFGLPSVLPSFLCPNRDVLWFPHL